MLLQMSWYTINNQPSGKQPGQNKEFYGLLFSQLYFFYTGSCCWCCDCHYKLPLELLGQKLKLWFIFITAVLFEDAVILGAATDAVMYHYKSPGELPGQAMHNLPFSTIERTVRS